MGSVSSADPQVDGLRQSPPAATPPGPVMSDWKDLYENPRLLTSAWGHCRIFAPEAYHRVRSQQLVPIVCAEALTLAAHFPICWRVQDGRAVLCVLRSLLDDGLGHPVRPTHASGALPLVLRAFPVAVSNPGGNDDEVWIDDTVADQPTDIGAPILLINGRLSRGAAQRVQAAVAFRRSIDFTRRLTDGLQGRDLLEPWPLDFEVGPDGRRVRFDDLMVVRSSALAGSGMLQHLQEFGVEAAMFMTAHRISLFRASILLQGARAAAARETPSPESEAPT
jgi:hypothetical protein